MSRMYRMVALLDVDATLPESEYDFWKEKLASCTECPADMLEGGEPSDPDSVDVYIRKDGVTRFCCEMEIALCGGYSDEEYAEDFRKAMHLLTKDTVLDFKVSLNCYYLEHDADLSVEYDRQALAA